LEYTLQGVVDGTEVAHRGISQFIMNRIVCLQIEQLLLIEDPQVKSVDNNRNGKREGIEILTGMLHEDAALLLSPRVDCVPA
jgi:hypothetical protein